MNEKVERSRGLSSLKDVFRSISPGFMGNLFNEDYSLFYRGYVFNVSKSSVDDYLSIKSGLSKPCPTAVFSNGYYEQVIQTEGRAGISVLRRLGSDDVVEIVSHDGRISASIGVPSDRFVYASFDCSKIDSNLKRLLVRDRGRLRSEQRAKNLGDIFLFHTIKIIASESGGAFSSEGMMKDLAESVLFNVSYSKGVPVMVSKSWRREVYSMKLRELDDISFPVRRYSSHLTSYYNLAIGSDSLILSYLALYKIIEHFFSESRESAVHEKLSNILASPEFRHSDPKCLREIQKIIKKHDVNMDEKMMLREVISRYVGCGGIVDWISGYEMENGKFFTEKRDIFGKTMSVNLSESSTIPNVADRIYHVRNAVVHNKESDGFKFVPYTGDEEILVHEVPLAMFIAESLIINTSKPFKYT